MDLKTLVEKSMNNAVAIIPPEKHNGGAGLQTITLKMADQERFDFYIVFTVILCGPSFCVY